MILMRNLVIEKESKILFLNSKYNLHDVLLRLLILSYFKDKDMYVPFKLISLRSYILVYMRSNWNKYKQNPALKWVELLCSTALHSSHNKTHWILNNGKLIKIFSSFSNLQFSTGISLSPLLAPTRLAKKGFNIIPFAAAPLNSTKLTRHFKKAKLFFLIKS